HGITRFPRAISRVEIGLLVWAGCVHECGDPSSYILNSSRHLPRPPQLGVALEYERLRWTVATIKCDALRSEPPKEYAFGDEFHLLGQRQCRHSRRSGMRPAMMIPEFP